MKSPNLVLTVYFLLVVQLNVSCSSTASKWAREVPNVVACGMNVEELQDVLGVEIITRETPDPHWGTHRTRADRGGSYIRFWIDEHGLQRVQVMKEYWLKRVHSGPIVDVCEH